MNTADFAATAPWSGIRGKPDSFTPSAHSHQIAELARSGAAAGDVPTWTGKKWEAKASGVVALREESVAGFARIDEELSAMASDVSSQAERIGVIEVSFTDGIAELRQELSAIASAESASAQAMTELRARIGSAESRIRRVDEVTGSAVESLSRSTAELTTRLEQSEASIINFSGVYATRTFAEAKKSEAISASFGSATALVEEEAIARADADGAIHAQWGVRLNANGRVIGRINLDGTNETSTLDFEAGIIRIWNGAAAVAPFEVSGGIVRMTNVVVSGEIDIGTGSTQFQVDSDRITFGDTTSYHFNYNYNEDYSDSVAMSLRLGTQPLTSISTGSTDIAPTEQWGRVELIHQTSGAGVDKRLLIQPWELLFGDGSTYDTTLWRSAANTLKTLGAFIASTLEANGGLLTVQATSGFAAIEVGGPSGAYIDLKKPFSDDADIRVQADTTDGIVSTFNGLDLWLNPSAGAYLKFGTRETGSFTVGGRIPIKDSAGNIRYLLTE